MRRLLMLMLGVFVLCAQLLAQNRTISGRITDAAGNPVPNASITVKGSNTGTTTSSDGTYSISVPANAKTIVVSSVGMQSQEVSIGAQNTLSVSLTTEDKTLSEVVVTGYQTVRRGEITGSIAKVSGEELAQRPIGSFTQILQGKATGVQVTGTSGRPGANAYIRIRGVGSINASSEPLIIIDGLAVNSTAYNMLNPNDIEDISVLKDASASSIYGSRAANGVIVVTTKKGKGKPELRYSFQYGQSKAQELKNVRMMNSQEKLRYEYEIGWTNPIIDTMITNRITAGQFPAGSDLESLTDAQRQDLWNLAASRGAGDWRDHLLQEAVTKTHEVSLNGSADKFRYYFSLNKGDNEGILFGSYWNRTGGRLNVDFAATDWFRIGTNLSASHTKESQVREPYNTQNLYASTFLYNPYEPVYLASGRFNPSFQGFSSLEGVTNNPQEFDRITTISSLFGEAKFFKYLTLKSQLGINYNTFKEEYYLKPGSDLATILGYNQKRDAGNQDFYYVFTNTANWNQTVGADHGINVLAGQEFTKNKFYSYSLTARGFPTPSVTTLENASQPTAATTSRSDWALISYFGKVTYDFRKKYFLDVSGRRDGSSRFGKNNQFANFWAVGAAWDITKEPFFSVNNVNTLRLKASYGTAGNFNIGNYDALGTYRLSARYNDLPAAVPQRLPNPELTWEQNENFDIGLEWGLFKNRLTGSVDYYNRKTNDLLYGVNVSQTTGFSSYTGNIGNLKNTGVEVALGGDVIRNKDLTWNVSASYSHNDNEVTKLYSDNATVTGNGGLTRLKVGEPVNTFFLVKWAGINPENGKNQFFTKDGKLTETYSSGDAVLMEGKSPNAKYFGSVNTNLSYKGFDLSAQLYYQGGNYIMNYMWQVNASEGENYNTNQFVESLDYWKKQGDKVQYANLLDPTQNATYDTDKYLQKGDYVSLRDVMLGYTLNERIAQKVKMKSLRFFVQGTNLWIGTKFKGIPEVGQANSESTITQPGVANLFGYPPFKAMTFGVDVRF